MNNIPPEKYYEACITYNLIKEFDIQFDIQLFPFSISQLEESEKGYDFGYSNINEIFLIQYKRPFYYKNSLNKLGWKIDIEQLTTLCTSNIGIRVFYALPNFTTIDRWYQGLEECYFIDAIELMRLLSDKLDQVSVLLKEENTLLRKWSFYFNNKTRLSNSYSIDLMQGSIVNKNLEELGKKLSVEENNQWIYIGKK